MRWNWLFAILLTTVALGSAGQAASPAEANLAEAVNEEIDSLFELYKHLHANPELSFKEDDTAAKLVSELEPIGFEVTTGVGGHGFVAVLENGPGPTVMVRTDLDALPVEEKTGLPYASEVKSVNQAGQEVYVMHACGHDVHMTSFIGTARLLSERKDEWGGTLVMIGQPAEERGAGSRAMLDDGLFERFPRPGYVLGMHVDAALETGRIGYNEGYVMANVDSVDITIRGVGGHGAYPHATKDPVVIAARVVMALQTIVSREVRPIDPAVVTVGSIHGGSKHNVIPDEVKLQLTVRSYTDETREQVLDAIERITLHTARSAGVPADREPEVELIKDEYTPALYNNPDLVGRIVPVWKEVLGEDRVVIREPEMGGEDFARYGRVEPKIPIFMFRVGAVAPERMKEAKEEGKPLPSLHSPLFRPEPRPTIKTGVRAMTAAALELLGKE